MEARRGHLSKGWAAEGGGERGEGAAGGWGVGGGWGVSTLWVGVEKPMGEKVGETPQPSQLDKTGNMKSMTKNKNKINKTDEKLF